jgi:hypothetical protein
LVGSWLRPRTVRIRQLAALCQPALEPEKPVVQVVQVRPEVALSGLQAVGELLETLFAVAESKQDHREIVTIV